MEENEQVFSDYPSPLKDIKGTVHVLEQRIPIEIQMEYFHNSNQLRNDTYAEIDDATLDTYKEMLHSDTIDVSQKKRILTTLAICKQAKAFRILEEFTGENPDAEIADWALMALMESSISLEADILEERQIYISTGLGGKGKKLRFYALLTAKTPPFIDYQKQVIEKEFAYFQTKIDYEIERINIEDLYAEILILVPLNMDIKEILSDILCECNQYGEFINEIITVTNVKELSQQEIQEICDKDNANKNK
jgi:hypothetical protein